MKVKKKALALPRLDFRSWETLKHKIKTKPHLTLPSPHTPLIPWPHSRSWVSAVRARDLESKSISRQLWWTEKAVMGLMSQPPDPRPPTSGAWSQPLDHHGGPSCCPFAWNLLCSFPPRPVLPTMWGPHTYPILHEVITFHPNHSSLSCTEVFLKNILYLISSICLS